MVNMLCIYPGVTHSAVVRMSGKAVIEVNPTMDNDYLIAVLEQNKEDIVLIKMITPQSKIFNENTINTCIWIGRFTQASPEGVEYAYPDEIKDTLCNNIDANATNIKQAVIDRYPATGIGHAWSALAIGLTWIEKQKEKNNGN